MNDKIKFFGLPLGPCTNMRFRAAPAHVPAAGTRVSPPKLPSAPTKCDQTLVAGSDTNVRPVRPPSTPENPSPATTLPGPLALTLAFFITSQIRNLPQCDHPFVAVSDTSVRPMRPVSATKNCVTAATILVSSATKAPPRTPVSPATKSPPNATVLS